MIMLQRNVSANTTDAFLRSTYLEYLLHSSGCALSYPVKYTFIF